jgi:hypothetical protein
MIACNAVFSKKTNARKAFWVSIVLVYGNLLQRFIGIPFDLVLFFAGLDRDKGSTLLLLRDKTNVNIATSSSRLDVDFPALWSEGMQEAIEENLVDSLWSIGTDGASRLGDCFRVERILKKVWPPCRKGAYGSSHTSFENVFSAAYATDDPPGPVYHDLPIGYLEVAVGLDGIRLGAEIIVA